MSRKRDRAQFSRQVPYSFSKRRRPLPPKFDTTYDLSLPDDNNPSVAAGASTKQQMTVVVVGLPSNCSVLDLKSRFEIYGSISRTRMDPNGLAYVTFRSHNSAQSAISASLDPSFGITILSKQVQVMWATDPVPQWREGVAKREGMPSKLVRAEVPLSRRGRSNKLGSAIVNPRDEINTDDSVNHDNNKKDGGNIVSGSNEAPKGREIIAYDDIL